MHFSFLFVDRAQLFLTNFRNIIVYELKDLVLFTEEQKSRAEVLFWYDSTVRQKLNVATISFMISNLKNSLKSGWKFLVNFTVSVIDDADAVHPSIMRSK